MLQFITGRSRSGKTTYISNKIKELSKNDIKTILIVPEQFTYETEKALFKDLSHDLFANVTVTSFTRLCTDIFKQFGQIAGDYADECAKTIIMEMAIDEISDALKIYKKSSQNKQFSKTMLETVTELKNAGLDEKEFNNLVLDLGEGYLYEKSKEISLIYSTYNALLLNKYNDPLDDIKRATKLVQDKNFFENYVVIFDEFKSFTANQNDLIKLIISKSIDTYFSLCLDIYDANENEISVFSSVYETYNKIKLFARNQGVSIKESIKLTEAYMLDDIKHLEQNIFSNIVLKSEDDCLNIKAVKLKNEYEEVDFCLSKIVELVQKENYRYNDIAIISRDFESYETPLEAGFRKYNLPYYMDKRSGISNKPLIAFIFNALACVTSGYTAENVLSLLKTGLTNYVIEDIAAFENYLYIWGVKGKRFNDHFYANPRGYKESFTNEDTETLEKVNEVREYVISRLNSFKDHTENCSGKKICIELINLLDSFNVREKIQSIINYNSEQENFELANEYSRVWDITMELVNTLAVILDDKKIAMKKYERLFSLIVSTSDIGTLPQSIDTVITGSAERIRLSGKKAIFVLGVNENVFPYIPSSSGVFTDRERKILNDYEINIGKPIQDKIKEERFVAYKILTMPKDKLFITCRKSDIAGKKMNESIIFSYLEKMFKNNIVVDGASLSDDFYCKSYRSGYSYLAKSFNDNSVLTSTLKSVLKEKSEYAEKISHLEMINNKKEFQILNKNNAKKLFGKNMNISPTRVEGFYQCHFKYFCEHGLRVYPLKKAELNPLETGTLIHSILYTVTKSINFKNDYDEVKVKELIKQELDNYIENVMGGVDDKTKRFLYLYNRILITILKVIEQMHKELVQSGFSPVEFEYEIADDKEILPLKLFGDDDTTVTITGKIDRIDSYTNNDGEKYIRIVDYKSGKKQFKLNDILYGLNLQMLIYLHCIWNNSTDNFKDVIPAGILYMYAGETSPSLKREAQEQEIEKQKIKNYTMNGLLLQNLEVLNGMEKSLGGLFIPITLNKDGSYSKSSYESLVSLNELAKINSYIDKLILDMASELHNGNIEAIPLEDSCSYCEYKSVCGKDKDSKKKQYLKFNKSEVLEQIPKLDEIDNVKED